uniref:Methyltransferase domain-containing protein n=1 Tax=Lates calcarifer TaxID=8187 RepID=A0A4W6DUY3_LATCA
MGESRVDHSRTAEEARVAFQSCKSSDPRDRVQFYDSWAQNYEKDHNLMSYRSPHLAVNFLSENFSGSRGEAQVLDVACGTGWVAKLMAELGFRHFVGVDGSKGMLELAAETGLYQDLRLVCLMWWSLPVLWMLVFVPVSVVREMCHAAKPGGFVCMVRGDHTGAPADKYKKDLERELQLMEEEGLWSLVGIKRVDRYMEDPHVNPERDDVQDKPYISGTVYLYQKSIDTAVKSRD